MCSTRAIMRLVLLATIKSYAMSTIKGLLGRPQERSRQAKLANGRWDTAAQENQPKQLRGCDTGYALATGSCEEANSMDACTAFLRHSIPPASSVRIFRALCRSAITCSNSGYFSGLPILR